MIKQKGQDTKNDKTKRQFDEKTVGLEHETKRREVDLLRGQLARAMADYDNLRKRVENEKVQFEKIANLKLILKLLPVLDILRRAQAHTNDEGVALTIKQFEEAIKDEGIKEIKPQTGDDFDAELHEAVEVEESTDKNKVGKIAGIELSGWKFESGPVIRYARVKVYQAKQ